MFVILQIAVIFNNTAEFLAGMLCDSCLYISLKYHIFSSRIPHLLTCFCQVLATNNVQLFHFSCVVLALFIYIATNFLAQVLDTNHELCFLNVHCVIFVKGPKQGQIWQHDVVLFCCYNISDYYLSGWLL